MVNVIERDSRRFRHSCLSRSTGTGGFPFSVTPQQHPLQTSTCAITRRLDANLGDDLVSSSLMPFFRVLCFCECTNRRPWPATLCQHSAGEAPVSARLAHDSPLFVHNVCHAIWTLAVDRLFAPRACRTCKSRELEQRLRACLQEAGYSYPIPSGQQCDRAHNRPIRDSWATAHQRLTPFPRKASSARKLDRFPGLGHVPTFCACPWLRASANSLVSWR